MSVTPLQAGVAGWLKAGTIEGSKQPYSPAILGVSMQVVSEKSHWYDKNGSAVHEVPYADPRKGLRPTTLRDAKKLLLGPSVTNVLSMLPKPGLINWKQEQIFYAALTLTREESESDQQFYYRVIADSKEQAKKAAAKGTLIHGLIQRGIEGHDYEGPPEYIDTIISVIGWLAKEFGKTSWISERTFAHPLGFGGAVDLHSPQVVIDFKTKDFNHADIEMGRVKGWPEQGIQLAAYREGVGHPKAQRINLFISRSNPGLVHPYYWDEKDNHWQVFCDALRLWKSLKNYDSAFE